MSKSVSCKKLRLQRNEYLSGTIVESVENEQLVLSNMNWAQHHSKFDQKPPTYCARGFSISFELEKPPDKPPPTHWFWGLLVSYSHTQLRTTPRRPNPIEGKAMLMCRSFFVGRRPIDHVNPPRASVCCGFWSLPCRRLLGQVLNFFLQK